ncbi:MAG: AraC family transcriptional regulator [Pseudomonadota bacterium]
MLTCNLVETAHTVAMLLIPFPFLTAAVLLALLLALRANRPRGAASISYAEGFFALAALQSILLGLRHGYALDLLGALLPVTAVLLPPLAYASFVRPAFCRGAWPHALPVVAVAVALVAFPPAIDLIVPLTFLVYAALLARFGLRGEQAMPWARLGDMASSRLALWVVVVALICSSAADVAIAIDFGRTGGANLGRIMGVVQALTVVGVAVLLWRSVPPGESAGEGAVDDAGDGAAQRTADFATVDAGVRAHTLYLDPDLNLQRLARKVGVPTKRVSGAVNAVEGMNVSQWINRLRIEHAQALLAAPERAVTEVIFESGFNTKSSFNREFKRVTGTTPSAWRAGRPRSAGGGVV